MKTFKLILILVKMSISFRTKKISKLLKCYTNTVNMELADKFFPTDEFTLSMWIRSDEFNITNGLQIFSQIDFLSESLIIQFQKNVNDYELSYNGVSLGNIEIGTGSNEVDIDSKTNIYLSWKHFSISYQKIDGISAHSTIYMDSLSYLLLDFALDFSVANFSLCKGVEIENSGKLYYADIVIFDTYFSTAADFQNLIFYPANEIAVFNLLSKDNKNRVLYKNFKSNHISPMLKILKQLPISLADEEEFSYQLNFEKKLFEFEIKYYSLINNSYVITTKILIIKPENTSERYCIYSRIDTNTDPLLNTFTSGKLGLFLEINNTNFTLNLKLNNISELNFTDTFYTTTVLTISLFIRNGIDLSLSPNYTTSIQNVKLSYNDSFINPVSDANLDLSNFSYEDKHIFGYSDPIAVNYSNLFFLEYSVRYNHQWSMTKDVFNSADNDCVISNFEQFSTKLLDDPAIDAELLSVNESNIDSTWCGLVDSPNCSFDPLGANADQISCFSKYLLYNNDNYHTCENPFLTENVYFCDISNLTVINIEFTGNSLSTTTINEIVSGLFTNGLDISNHFSVIITLDITSQGINFKFQRSFLSLISSQYLTIKFFQNYFINFPNSTFLYKLYYKYITPSEYQNLDLYDQCIQTSNFYQESNFISNCLGTCSAEYYSDLSICIKCEDGCKECEYNGHLICTICKEGYHLYKKTCIFTDADCLALYQHCDVCDLNDDKKCVGCKVDYHFIQSKDICGLDCTVSDGFCQSCVFGVEDECQSCVDLYSLVGGVCERNCLFYHPFAESCQSGDVTAIESCVFGYDVEPVGNTCEEGLVCYENDINCLGCDSNDFSKCVLCEAEFSLVDFSCVKNCLTNENIIDCFDHDVSLIKICQKDYDVDFVENKCVLICPDNCEECIKMGFEILCVQCSEDFVLNGFTCIPNYCISNFCLECEIDYTFDCEKCLNCENKEILFCQNILNNCDTCMRIEEEYKCIKCKEGFYLTNNCLEITTSIFNNTKIITEGEFFLEKDCLKNYFLVNGVCDKESNNCDIGCFRCFEINFICLECNNGLEYNVESNKCLKEGKKIVLLENPLIKYFDFPNHKCNEYFNNITYIKEINETFYQNNINYEVKKNTEIQNYMINCRENRLECGKLVNLNETDIEEFENCDKVNKVINEVIYNEYTNITFMAPNNYCSTNKEEYFCYDKEINCLNENCTDYKKIKICHKHKNIEICKENYKNLEFENLKEIEIFDNSEFCQLNEKYYSEWRKECRQKCNFKLEKNLKINLINDLKNSKVIFDFKKLKLSLPFYINIQYKDRGEKIEISINENYKNAILSIQPKHIAKAINCTVHEAMEINIVNDKFFQINPIILEVVNNFDSVLSISIFILNIVFPQFLTMEIIELLQFNEFFLYLYFLNLDGGSFFNYFSSNFVQKPDNDLFLVREGDFFEYSSFMNKFEKLVISSVVNYSLFIFITIIIFLRIAYHFISPKINKIIRKMTKTSKREYDKIVGFKRKILQIKVFLLTVNYDIYIHRLYTVIWDMNLIKIPAYLVIFTWKINFFFFPLNLIMAFYFLFFMAFFFYNFVIIGEYFQLRSFSISEKILIIKNRNFMDENYYLLWQAVIYRFLMIFQIFFIIFFNNHTFFVVFFVIFLRLLNFGLNIYFSNKNIKNIVYIKIFSLLVFLTWMFLVFIANLFNSTSFNVVLNITYIMSNVFKVLETICIVFLIRKLKKMDKKSLQKKEIKKQEKISKIIIE